MVLGIWSGIYEGKIINHHRPIATRSERLSLKLNKSEKNKISSKIKIKDIKKFKEVKLRRKVTNF